MSDTEVKNNCIKAAKDIDNNEDFILEDIDSFYSNYLIDDESDNNEEQVNNILQIENIIDLTNVFSKNDNNNNNNNKRRRESRILIYDPKEVAKQFIMEHADNL